jgi:hypothetical protein
MPNWFGVPGHDDYWRMRQERAAPPYSVQGAKRLAKNCCQRSVQQRTTSLRAKMMTHQRFEYAATALSVCWALGLLPREVFPQLRAPDPRGTNYEERLFPRFLTDPHGQILVQDGCVAIYYASGLGFKEKAYTWDLHRCEVETRLLKQAW